MRFVPCLHKIPGFFVVGDLNLEEDIVGPANPYSLGNCLPHLTLCQVRKHFLGVHQIECIGPDPKHKPTLDP